MNTIKPTPKDVRVEGAGSVILLRPLSKKARAWFARHLAGATWFAGAVACEYRYACDISVALAEDGLRTCR